MNAAYVELVRAAREVLGCLKCDPQMERTHWSFRQSSHPTTHKAIMDLMAASASAELIAANGDPNAEEDRWQSIETAPMDGTEVELLTHSGKRDIGKWCPSLDGPGGEWSTQFGNFEAQTETQPLADPKAWRPIRDRAITKREIEAEEDAP